MGTTNFKKANANKIFKPNIKWSCTDIRNVSKTNIQAWTLELSLVLMQKDIVASNDQKPSDILAKLKSVSK